MCVKIVMFNYPESHWGTDVVGFIFQDAISEYDFSTTLHDARLKVCKDYYDGLPEYVDAICDEVVESIGGTWNYLHVSCNLDIIY